MAKVKRKRQYDKNPVCNRKIRALIAGFGLRYGEIADHIYISQSTLGQWFMHEMKDWQREAVIKAIAELVWEKEIENEEGEKERTREDFVRSVMDDPVGVCLDSVFNTHIEQE